MANVIPGPHSIINLIGDGYVNHTDLSAVDGAGNIFGLVTVLQESKTNTFIIKRESGTGILSVVHVFYQDIYGKQGYGSLSVKGAHVVVWLPLRQYDGQTLPQEFIITDVAVKA